MGRLIDAERRQRILEGFARHLMEAGKTEAAEAVHTLIKGLKLEPTVCAMPLTEEENKHLINDTQAYIWRLESRGCDTPEYGYDSRKELLEKLKAFYNEHFPELVCCGGRETDGN